VVEALTADLAILARLVLAMVLGGAIGWEREQVGKAAGVRTQMLVAMSAALSVALGERVLADFAEGGEAVRADPLRVIEAVVAGVSFLGAGMVFVSRGQDRVRGLTTAATTWATATIGIAVGIEHYALATGGTVLLLVVLHVVPRLYERTGADAPPSSTEER
jgi:putative Mg2+ transporter-C (MgtC) family protein